MEKLNATKPTIIIEDIRNAKKQGYSTMRLRWMVKEGGGSNFLGQFLGNLESKGRVAFQTISNDILKENGIKVGDNLNDKLPVPARITVTELSHSEYESLEVQDQRGFSAKLNPSTREYLVSEDGEYIYRNSRLTPTDVADTFISHTGTTSEAPEEVTSEVTEDDIPA